MSSSKHKIYNEDSEEEQSRHKDEREPSTPPQQEEEEDVFDINHLIRFFERNKIETRALYSIEKSIKAILIKYMNDPMELLVYVPSKYDIRVTKKDYTAISRFNLEDDDDDDEIQAQKSMNPSLFNNQVAVDIVKAQRLNSMKALERFLPLLNNSKVKISYMDRSFVTFMKNKSDIVSYLCSNRNDQIGYFYTVDLDTFYALQNELLKEVALIENELNNSVYIKLEFLIETNKELLTKLHDDMQKTTPKQVKVRYDNRMSALKKISTNEAKKSVALDVMNEVRKDNFKQMFKLEYLANVLNELKYMEQQTTK